MTWGDDFQGLDKCFTSQHDACTSSECKGFYDYVTNCATSSSG